MSEVDTAAIEQPAAIENGAAGLDNLLAEFDASTARAAQPAPTEPMPNETPAVSNEHSGLTLDDFADPDSRYYRDRDQAAYAQRATEQARQELQALARARDDADTSSLLKEIRGDLDSTVHDDKAVRAFIIGEALEDPSIKEIFDNRANNPRAYEGLRRQLMREFHRRASARPDPDLTDDRDMVAAAVRGASQNRPPEDRPPAYGGMSNVEYRNEVRQRYGFDPGV